MRKELGSHAAHFVFDDDDEMVNKADIKAGIDVKSKKDKLEKAGL